MHDKLMKLMLSKKKEGKMLSDHEQKAKMEALTGMKDMANEMMGEKLKGIKKVTVASDSQEGLKQGLDKAKEAVGLEEEEEEPSEKGMSPEEAEMESSEEPMDKMIEMCDTPEKIEELMAKLQAKKEEIQQN